MTTIKNYILASVDNRRKWQIPFVGQRYLLIGDLQKKTIRAEVCIVERNCVKILETGEVFKIKDPHPDYKEFERSAEKCVPIINFWHIKGNIREGYYISGFVNLIPIKKKIKKQKGNFLILEDDVCYFVMWHNYSNEFAFRMFECSILGDDIKFPEQFREFGDSRCKPIIPDTIK